MGIVDSKVFRSGNSEAVRLPREVAFGANIDVTIERRGDTLTIRPKHDPAEERRRVAALLADLAAIGRPDDGVQARPDFEAPERRGL